MAVQRVEYEFPDPDDEGVKAVAAEVDQDDDDDNGKPAKPEKPKEKEGSKTLKFDDIEIEIEDDTPPEDRGRKKSEPPEEVTDDELESYSEKVKKRIQRFSKGYHDERREKERVLREREELERYAKQLVEENRRLKGSETRSHNTLIESAKKQVEGELKMAQRMYKEAYEAGDSDRLLEAQQALNAAQIRADRLSSIKPKALQQDEIPVQGQIQPANPAPASTRDAKAEAWREENTWFGSDDVMTAHALGYHSKLVKEGVDPRSDEYYEKVNSHMRKMFPDQFDDDDQEDSPPTRQRKAPNVVAPASRSTAPKKIRLTESQRKTAERLGVPVEEYARQVAALAGGR